jgi:hypothetical protein
VTPTEHLNLLRTKLDSLVKLRLKRPLDPKAEQAYRALCDREQELLRTVHPEQSPDRLATNQHATPRSWSDPPEIMGWTSPVATSTPGYDNAETQVSPWQEQPHVHWPSS